MKLITIGALLGVLFCNTTTTASAADDTRVPVAEVQQIDTVSTTGHLSLSSKYLSFGSGIELTDKPVLQGDITLNFDRTGIYALIWASTSFDSSYGKNSSGSIDFGDEIDLGVGWSGQVLGLATDFGLTYFDEPLIGHEGADDILYTHLKIGKVLADGYTLSASFENYWALPGSALGGGNLYGLELSNSWHLASKLTLSASTTLVYDDGGFGTGSGLLIRGATTLSYQLSDSLSIDGGCRFYLPTMSDYRSPDATFWFGATKKF